MSVVSLLPVYRWFEHSAMGVAVRGSAYAFPVVECVHLLGMVCVLGPILVVDLRLLGLGLRKQAVARVASALAPVMWAGLGTMIASGILLFSSEAIRCYANVAFSYKMVFLLLALILHLTGYRWLTRREDARIGPISGRLVACLSLASWFGVAICGRMIAFVP